MFRSLLYGHGHQIPLRFKTSSPSQLRRGLRPFLFRSVEAPGLDRRACHIQPRSWLLLCQGWCGFVLFCSVRMNRWWEVQCDIRCCLRSHMSMRRSLLLLRLRSIKRWQYMGTALWRSRGFLKLRCNRRRGGSLRGHRSLRRRGSRSSRCWKSGAGRR